MNICGIVFKDNGKVYNFDAKDINLKIGDYVIVETEKGEQIGKVFDFEDRNKKTPIKEVKRIATKADYNTYLKNLKDAKQAQTDARIEAEKLNLKMQLIDAAFTFDRKQLLINFIADERVDFRDLVKVLAAKYKTRIELHQMGVRDKAKEIGGIGICGKKLCCAQYLNKIDTISINMAKNQNIALNPAKINGCCGRLLCCLAYEDEVYKDHRSLLPTIGQQVKIEDKVGTVIFLDVLNKKYKVNFGNEIKEYTLNE